MSSQPVANANSTGSHGGGFTLVTSVVTSGSAFGRGGFNAFVFNGAGNRTLYPLGLTDNGLQVLRVGDTYDCPTHGRNPIVAGSRVWTDDDRPIVRLGDPTACGATVTPPVSPEWRSE